jgi:thymidylate synthase (FAD)
MKTTDIKVTPIHPERWGNDLDVVNAARVSFNKQSEFEVVPGKERFEKNSYKLSDKDVKLINYLAKHKHHSPFNHAFLSFRVKAPIFVARQLVKHKFMPWNEVSRRYVDDEPEFYFPDYWRAKADNVKQGSSDERFCNGNTLGYIDDAAEAAFKAYSEAISKNMCPEQARMVLPQNTMTEWVWSGTLGAFLDMLVLRLDSHTQKETRDVAEKIAVFVKNIFPVSYAAYIKETT